MTSPSTPPLADLIAELWRLMEAAWPAPWVARTFEIDCPCPNGSHCGESHTCEEIEAREAYPASPEEPADEGDGQCVVQISVPGLESLAGPCAAFIATIRNAAPRLLSAAERAEGLARAAEAFLSRVDFWSLLHEERISLPGEIDTLIESVAAYRGSAGGGTTP